MNATNEESRLTTALFPYLRVAFKKQDFSPRSRSSDLKRGLMKAVILVGGEGTRMRPFTLSTPKPLLPVAGRTMIERVAHHLVHHGIDSLVLALGYLPQRFVDYFPKFEIAGLPVSYCVEDRRLDTAGALRHAVDQIGITDTFVAMNGDILTDLDIGELVASHRASGASATLAVRPVEDPSAFGVVVTRDDGRVTRFVEKPTRGEAPSRMVNAGVYVFDPDGLDGVSPTSPSSLERDVFPDLAADARLHSYAFDDYWEDAGTPESFSRASFAAGGRDGADGTLEYRNGSWIAPDAAVRPGAVIRDSVVNPGCWIGPDARVERCVLLPHTVVPRGAAIRDLVMSPRGMATVFHGTT